MAILDIHFGQGNLFETLGSVNIKRARNSWMLEKIVGFTIRYCGPHLLLLIPAGTRLSFQHITSHILCSNMESLLHPIGKTLFYVAQKIYHTQKTTNFLEIPTQKWNGITKYSPNHPTIVWYAQLVYKVLVNINMNHTKQFKLSKIMLTV